MTEHSRRGFASMELDKQRPIAEKGGRAAHAKGTAHEFTTDEAREAGRRGASGSAAAADTWPRSAERAASGRRRPGLPVASVAVIR